LREVNHGTKHTFRAPKMKSENQERYSKTKKGKNARLRAQMKYDKTNIEKRRAQKREYMRRKRAEDPNYCKWK